MEKYWLPPRSHLPCKVTSPQTYQTHPQVCFPQWRSDTQEQAREWYAVIWDHISELFRPETAVWDMLSFAHNLTQPVSLNSTIHSFSYFLKPQTCKSCSVGFELISLPFQTTLTKIEVFRQCYWNYVIHGMKTALDTMRKTAQPIDMRWDLPPERCGRQVNHEQEQNQQ